MTQSSKINFACVLLLMEILVTACGPSGFKAAKQEVLSRPVFTRFASGSELTAYDEPGSSPGTATGTITAPGTEPGSGTISSPGTEPGTGTIPSPGTNSPPANNAIPPLSVRTYFYCSIEFSAPGSLSSASEVEIQFLSADGNVACRYSDGVRDKMLNERKIELNPCAGMSNGVYTVKAVDKRTQVSLLVLQNPVDPAHASLTVRLSGGRFVFVNPATYQEPFQPLLYVIYGTNPGGGNYTLTLTPQEVSAPAPSSGDGYGKRGVSGSACEAASSPLVVDTASNVEQPEPISLSAPLEGILFDILGRNSFPSPHAPKRISWIRNPARYQFLGLPGASGEVRGIDELFGDNTFGPDRRFASDGFAALAKYDGYDWRRRAWTSARDGKITAHDSVYHRLVLWADLNGDGIGQKSELTPLAIAGVSEIDLNFDPNYSETDVYGNQTRLKSTVKYSDSRLRLIFDLWFRYLNP